MPDTAPELTPHVQACVKWLTAHLDAAGGSAEGWVVRGVAASAGFEQRTLRRAAAHLESLGRLSRRHFGNRDGRSVMWHLTAPKSPRPSDAALEPEPVAPPAVPPATFVEPVPVVPGLCAVCGHTAPHTARGLMCPSCPDGNCTPKEA